MLALMIWGAIVAAGAVALGAAQGPAAPDEAREAEAGSATTAEAERAQEEGTGGAGASGTRPRSFDALGVPLLSYNSDLGWGIGLVGGGYYYAQGYTPYRHALAAQTFFTTEGVQNHWLRYDGPDLLGKARLEVRAEFRRELLAPFYGVGNLSGAGFEEGVSEERLWTFDHFFPGGWARVRTRPGGSGHPMELYGGYGFNWVRVNPYEGSRLQADGPQGLAGGPHARALMGAAWDSRDSEADPTRGGVEELSLRISAPPLGSRYAYGGITLSERRFFSLGTPRLILAQRLVLDVLFGEPPFFEWAQIGGMQGGEGVGGMSSVRGVPRNRYQGNIKAISNTELRFYVFDFPLFGEPVKFGGVVYWDMGRVWHPGVEDGAWHAWHPGVGGGLRLARRAAVVRFDYAVATENLRQGIYVTFGHMF
jgi:hypothetical protein